MPSVKEFKAWFEHNEHEHLGEHEEEESEGDDTNNNNNGARGGGGGGKETGGNGDGDEDGGQEVGVVVKLAVPVRNTAEDDAILLKLGLSSEQIEYLHKIEEPKLSLMRELTGLEQGQRRLLAAIDLMTRRSKDLEEAHGALGEQRAAAAAANAKRMREEAAEAKEDEARKELLTRD